MSISMSGLRQQVGVDDGTVGAPSVSFSNDGNTGLYRPTADVIGVVTAGVERMRVDATGNVGIGMTNPRAMLHCLSNIETDNRLIGKESLSLIGRYTIIHHRSDGYEFLVNRNAWDSEAWYSDATSKAMYMQIPAFSGDTLYTLNPSVFNSSYYQAALRSTVDGTKPTPPVNTTYFDVRLYNGRSTPTHMTWKGNVGIGTTNPSQLLSIGSSGAGFPAPPGAAPMYACRAWVCVRPSGGNFVTIADSRNVSSVTRNGLGDFTIAFTTAMSSAHYAIAISQSRNDIGTNNIWDTSVTAGSVRVQFFSAGTVLYDPGFIYTLAVFQ